MLKYLLTQKKNRGSILILTLSVLAVLAILGVNLGYGVRQKLILLERLDTKNKLHFIAEAGVKRAILELRREEEDACAEEFLDLILSWRNNPSAFKEIHVGEGTFTVGYSLLKDVDSVMESNELKREEIEEEVEIIPMIRYGLVDEEGKVNVNTTGVEPLKRLFQNVVDLDEESAEELAYCIIDWRDEDSEFQHPAYGAEDGYYRNLRKPYEAKDSEYEILEELLLVKGMNREIFDKVKDYLTVLGEGGVNINTASEEVLSALGLNDELVSEILSFRCGDDLEEATHDDNTFTSTSEIVTELKQFTSLDISQIAQLEALISNGKLTVTSENFMIKSTAKLDNKDITHLIVAIVNSGGEIKYWREK